MSAAIPSDLSLVPLSRRPLRLPDATLRAVVDMQLPESRRAAGRVGVSLVMVTYNNVVFTRLCLTSVLANTVAEPDYEVIVVDNASIDGTVAYLREIVVRQPRVRLIENACNRGFAPAVNQGVDLARGDVLVLLNNDTLVPQGWLDGLLRHLADPAVGLVGPVTNAAGNEAQIEAPYTTYGGFERFAAERSGAPAARFDIPTLTMFCVALRRDTYTRLGPLDERFAVGMFEDDDYSLRARLAGYAVVCAEDVFVHHFGQASFGELVPNGEYAQVFAANRRRFEDKWGLTWRPHMQRISPAYASLVARIRALMLGAARADATVLVVSKGDEALLALGPRWRAWHFPRLEDGTYAGYYPADSSEAIAQLEQLRAAGAEYLLFPATSLWWLDYYAGLRQHLEELYRCVRHEPDTCAMYALDRRLSA